MLNIFNKAIARAIGIDMQEASDTSPKTESCDFSSVADDSTKPDSGRRVNRSSSTDLRHHNVTSVQLAKRLFIIHIIHFVDLGR